MTPDLSIKGKLKVGSRIAANTGLMMGAKACAAVMGLGSLWLASRALSVPELGVILFLHAYMLFFSELGTFQSWQSIIRFGTDDVKENDAPHLAKLLQFGYKIDALAALLAFLLSLAVFSVVVWVIGAFPDVFSGSNPEKTGDLRRYAALYCLLLLIRQRGTSIGIFRLFNKFNILALQGIIMPVTRFTGVIIATLLGAGFEGFLLAWFIGSFVAYIFLPVMGLVELHRRKLLGLVGKAKSSLRRPRKGLWPFMIKSSLDSTLAASSVHLPVLLVQMVFGSAWVAVYRIAEEAAKLLSEGFQLLDQVIYPELAKMVSHGEVDKIWRLVRRTALALLSFGLLMALLVIWVGPWVFSATFSDDYRLAAPLTSLLVPAAALLGIAAPLYPVLYASGKPERAIFARGLGVLVYVISFFVLSHTIGKMAPGWAAILGNATAVIVLVITARYTLKRAVRKQKKGLKI